ncbi:hypothetical protein [Paraburkholderia phenoliruptrix]|uniref:hypothetical protein n=1 Tax=Paraburkholderia phenoliruptrix TaxID=252970 RepID=UPI00286728B7|nr:hypothetical protein [Paraburkholderia phenoliruptrix]MDR6393486.1 hypothetical protein [Paraburkholderia phenoliruptrix]
MKVEIKGFILFGRHEWECCTPPYYKFYNYDETEGFVKVQEHSFEVEVPAHFDPRPQMVEKLEKEKKKIEAEFQARVTHINAQIQSLLAIEA